MAAGWNRQTNAVEGFWHSFCEVQKRIVSRIKLLTAWSVTSFGWPSKQDFMQSPLTKADARAHHQRFVKHVSTGFQSQKLHLRIGCNPWSAISRSGESFCCTSHSGPRKVNRCQVRPLYS